MQDIVFTRFRDAHNNAWTHAHTDKQDKNSMPPATLYWVEARGVWLAKNDFGSVFGLVLQKTAVFGSFLLN